MNGLRWGRETDSLRIRRAGALDNPTPVSVKLEAADESLFIHEGTCWIRQVPSLF